MIARRLLVSALVLGHPSAAPARQRPSDHGSIVIVMGGEPSTPVPTLLGMKANDDVSDLLFLRLARPGQGKSVADERGCLPNGGFHLALGGNSIAHERESHAVALLRFGKHTNAAHADHHAISRT